MKSQRPSSGSFWGGRTTSAAERSQSLDTDRASATLAPSREGSRLGLEINNGLPMREAITFQELIDRYISEEIERGELAHTTKEPDLNRINKHISPRWGICLLREVKPYPVQDWLRKLPLGPKTRGHIRSLMHRLFEKAIIEHEGFPLA